MHRICVLMFGLLITTPATFGQSSSTDSQTLQALLAEVRQMHQDLQTTTVAAQRAQILLYRLKVQEEAVERASQRVEAARAKLAETQVNRKRLATDIKRHEEFLSHVENPPNDRKQVEDILPQLKERAQSLETEEEQRQTAEVEAEEQQRVEKSKLSELQGALEQLDAALASSSQKTKRP